MIQNWGFSNGDEQRTVWGSDLYEPKVARKKKVGVCVFVRARAYMIREGWGDRELLKQWEEHLGRSGGEGTCAFQEKEVNASSWEPSGARKPYWVLKAPPESLSQVPSQTSRAESHKALLARMPACRSYPGGQAPLRFLLGSVSGCL